MLYQMEIKTRLQSSGTLKILLCALIPLCLASGFLAGIRNSVVTIDGKVIDRGYFEIFIFLVSSSAVLAVLLLLIYFLESYFKNRTSKIGIVFISISLVFFGCALFVGDLIFLYNYLAGFYTEFRLQDFEIFLIVFAAFPATILFSIGVFLTLYGPIRHKLFKINP